MDTWLLRGIAVFVSGTASPVSMASFTDFKIKNDFDVIFHVHSFQD
jgi:hypothetical protein